MGIEIDLIDNSPAYIEAVKRGVKLAVKAIAKQGATNVANITPVDTGRLKGSIEGRSDEDTAYIGTNVEYAAYVEFGTYKMVKQPYLKPGIMDNMDQYEEIAKKNIESCLP